MNVNIAKNKYVQTAPPELIQDKIHVLIAIMNCAGKNLYIRLVIDAINYLNAFTFVFVVIIQYALIVRVYQKICAELYII